MEFFLGFVFSFILIWAIRTFIARSQVNEKYAISKIVYRQSYIYSLVGQKMADLIMPKPQGRTQSRDLLSKNEIRVVFSDNQAYWIKDSLFYQADVVNGKIDNSTTKIVDTMALDSVELDKMFFIVQKLTEGNNNDGGNSGFKNL